jgi:deoxyribodipyrimidine photo-lyase
MSLGLFIFRRDFRLVDNEALHELQNKVDRIVPIFIFDPFQVNKTKENRNYRSEPAIHFMIESLMELNKKLKQKKSQLYVYYGKPSKIVEKIIQNNRSISHIGFNADYSRYSIERDGSLIQLAFDLDLEPVIGMSDLILHKYDEVLTGDGDPYKTFGGYYKRAVKLKVPKPKNETLRFVTGSISISMSLPKSDRITLTQALKKFGSSKDLFPDLIQRGGREEGLKLLRNMKRRFNKYHLRRNEMGYETTRLSPHLKFGTISIREAYRAMKKIGGEGEKTLIRQLYWRCFYFILAKYQDLETRYGHIDIRFKKVRWTKGKKLNDWGEKLWTGQTGFPTIDAAVRQLNATGWMQNRGRLIVANFSVKILGIDPFGTGKWAGQSYFSKKLTDCCYGNNYGNWMWILGPYDTGGYRFGKKATVGGRVFRDIVKFQKWDPDLKFVRKWLPELDDVPDKDLANWDKKYKNYDVDYPNPMVDFNKQVNAWYEKTKKSKLT